LPGVNHKVLASILQSRQEKPFTDLEDFTSRAGISVAAAQKGNLEKQITF
jgi:predicted nucleic acid-binding OB-fold protein